MMLTYVRPRIGPQHVRVNIEWPWFQFTPPDFCGTSGLMRIVLRSHHERYQPSTINNRPSAVGCRLSRFIAAHVQGDEPGFSEFHAPCSASHQFQLCGPSVLVAAAPHRHIPFGDASDLYHIRTEQGIQWSHRGGSPRSCDTSRVKCRYANRPVPFTLRLSSSAGQCVRRLDYRHAPAIRDMTDHKYPGTHQTIKTLPVIDS